VDEDDDEDEDDKKEDSDSHKKEDSKKETTPKTAAGQIIAGTDYEMPDNTTIHDYIHGEGKEVDKENKKKAEAQFGAQKVGKFVFFQYDPSKTEKCLKDYFFCLMECKKFFPYCKVDAKLYSIFVTRKQHALRCVKPRITHPIKRKVDDAAYRNECLVRPCSCKIYDKYFKDSYGEEYEEGLKMIQAQCRNWCDTGIRPENVLDTSGARTIISVAQVSLIAALSAEIPMVKSFVEKGIIPNATVIEKDKKKDKKKEEKEKKKEEKEKKKEEKEKNKGFKGGFKFEK